MRVAVVGAGVAGLAAARHFKAIGTEVILLEQGLRVGGLVQTHHHQGFIFELGPDGFLASKPQMMSVIEELDLADRLITGGPGPRRAFVATSDKLQPLPAGLFRFERRTMLALLRSNLLSPSAKARLFLEPLVGVHRANEGVDEDVASFFTRRLGKEVADSVVAPMLRGIYGASAASLGMDATMPKLSAMELKFGSLGLALLAAKRSTPGIGMVTLRDGMGSLVSRMAAPLGCSLKLGAPAQRLRVSGHEITIDGGRLGQIKVDGLVLACPGYSSARLLSETDPWCASELDMIVYNGVDVLALAYDPQDVPNEMPGTGFVVSEQRESPLLACTWTTQKWAKRAPDDTVLLRCVARLPQLDEQELIASVRSELREIMGIEAAPRETHIRRHARALPAYGPGHRARVKEIRERISERAPIVLAGNAYDGVGVPDCIGSGIAAAESLGRMLGVPSIHA